MTLVLTFLITRKRTRMYPSATMKEERIVLKMIDSGLHGKYIFSNSVNIENASSKNFEIHSSDCYRDESSLLI